MQRLITFFICFFIFISGAYSQQSEVFRHLNHKQGLSHNRVTCILQDNRGLIWVGTEDGLNRYNGYKVDVYKHAPSDSSSVSSSSIRCLFQDGKGTLWIGTDDGLNYFDLSTEKFHSYKHNDTKNSISSNQITCIEQDEHGNLLIGTAGGGINLFNTSTSTWTTFTNSISNNNSVCSNNITDIAKDKEGILYFATDKGISILKNSDSQKFETLTAQPGNTQSLVENEITSLYADYQDKLWIGYLNSGISTLNLKTHAFNHYQNEPGNANSISSNSVFGICKDLDGNIIVGTIGGGLNVLNPSTNNFKSYKNDIQNIHSISSNTIWCLHRDESGLVWIGTDKGVDYYKANLMRFKTEAPYIAASENLLNTNTYCFAEDKQNNLWMGVLGSGVIVKNQAGNVIGTYNTSNGLSDNNVFSIYTTPDVVWVGTFNGLNAIDKKTGAVKKYVNDKANPQSLSNNNIRCISADRQNNLWIGTFGGGLNKFDVKTEKFTVYNRKASNIGSDIIVSVFTDDDGKIYVGTYGGGLSVYNSSNNSFTNYTFNASSKNSISSNYVNCILKYTDHQFLIGTYGGGINLFDKNSDTFIQVTENTGLPNNNITGIVIDFGKNVWLSTGNEICRVNIDDNGALQNVHRFDEQDGVTNRFNPGAFIKNQKGEILFGGANGINHFNPINIKDNPYIPPVVITRFYLFEKPYFMDTIIMSKSVIDLRYNQNFFEFEFAALNYVFPEKNCYAYMLEGLETEWSYCGTKRNRQYTNLDPGTYRFRVKACNNDGVWNEEGTFIIIRIKPPWYKTWWFYLISALAFAAITIGYIRWRTAVIRKQYELLEQKVQERTSELRAEKEKTEQKSKELEVTLNELRDTQSQLVHAEKMASLGQLTAGIAHEIQNPLNFVNNFSQLSKEMIDELANTATGEQKEDIMYDLRQNIIKIHEHGKRAERIVKSMLMHSRTRTAEKALTEINKIAEDALNLSHTSLRAKDHQFTSETEILLDEKIPPLNIVQQDISRVLLNLLNNAFYAVNERRKKEGPAFKPMVKLNTQKLDNKVRITISDNGTGIPHDVKEKIFQPFFTTKPTGEGTGLGLSLSYDIIVKGHGGEIKVNSTENTGTEFIIDLPIT